MLRKSSVVPTKSPCHEHRLIYWTIPLKTSQPYGMFPTLPTLTPLSNTHRYPQTHPQLTLSFFFAYTYPTQRKPCSDITKYPSLTRIAREREDPCTPPHATHVGLIFMNQEINPAYVYPTRSSTSRKIPHEPALDRNVKTHQFPCRSGLCMSFSSTDRGGGDSSDMDYSFEGKRT